MAGRGVVEDVDRVVNTRVLMFDRNLEWKPAVDPVHFDKAVAGVGPGRSFGLTVAAADTSIRVDCPPRLADRRSHRGNPARSTSPPRHIRMTKPSHALAQR